MSGQNYTEDEDQAIMRIYGKCLRENLSDYLFTLTGSRRSNDAIRLRANRLGVKRPDSDLTPYRVDMLAFHYSGMTNKEIAEIMSECVGRFVDTKEVQNRVYHMKREPTFYGTITDRIGMTINKFLKLPAPGAYQ